MVVQLMVMRFLGAGIAAALCVAFCALFSTPVAASGENYAWSDYAAIEGYNGNFTDITGQTNDQAAFNFGQTEGNPNIFMFSIQVPGKCQGQLIITLSDTDPGKGKLTSSGDCPIYNDMDHDITITRSELVKEKVTQESTALYNAYERKTCNPEQMADGQVGAPVVGQPASYSSCISQAKQNYKDAQTECSATHDYEKFPQRTNSYLDCIAQKLGVEREGADAAPEEEEESEPATCSIPDIGWMMCQVLEFLGWITDQAFNILSSMLEVEPLQEQVNGQDSKLYAAWKVSLTFANVVFVFAFLFMILSYVTSWGIGAYGIKKLVPRMIIAAVLVNLSFMLCGVAVDLSNILGGTLKNTLVAMTPPTSGSPNYENWTRVTETVVAITPNDPEYTASNQPGADNNAQPDPNAAPAPEPEPASSDPDEGDLFPPMTEVLLGGLLITGGAVLWANLSALVPFMVSALIAIITVLVVLIIRQAVIIILIAIAPIAIAMYVLPNTKQWMDKWFDIFSKFLLIYPAVALVFGASYFASRVVLDQASENGQTFLAMFALGIQVIPLFITPIIMKFGAGVLDRFAGVVNNPNKGPFDAMRRGAKAFREDRKNQQLGRAATGPTAGGTGLKNFMKNPNAARLRRNMKRDAADAAIDSALSRSQKIAANSPAAITNAAKGIKPGEFYDALVEESLADAAKELDDIKVGRIHAAAARFANDKDMNDADLHNMALTGHDKNGNALTDIERAAAVQMAANTAQSKEAHDLILASGNMDKAIRRILVDNLRKSGFAKQNAHFGGSALNSVIEGKVNSQADVQELVRRAAEGGKYSSANLAGQSAYSLDLVNGALDSGKLSPAASERIMQNAHNALATPAIEKGINTNSRAGVERLAR